MKYLITAATLAVAACAGTPQDCWQPRVNCDPQTQDCACTAENRNRARATVDKPTKPTPPDIDTPGDEEPDSTTDPKGHAEWESRDPGRQNSGTGPSKPDRADGKPDNHNGADDDEGED